MNVAVGVGVLVGVFVGVGVSVAVSVGVAVAVLVGVSVDVRDAVIVGVGSEITHPACSRSRFRMSTSSMAKSLPLDSSLVSMIWMVAVVLVPEFQLAANSTQTPDVEGALIVPIVVSLIMNFS